MARAAASQDAGCARLLGRTVVLLCAFALVPAGPALAQAPVCDPTGELVEDLLGDAALYSEFVRGDVRQINETEGRLAVGGTFTVSTSGDVGFRAGFGLPPESRPSLVVGGDLVSVGSFIQLLTLQPGVLGSATFGGQRLSGGRDEGTFTQAPPPFSFETAFADLSALADFLATCPTSAGATVGSFQGTPGTLLLTATDPDLSVFNLTTSQLQATRSVYLDVPAGATTLVNVLGSSYSTEVTPNADFWIAIPRRSAARSCRCRTAGYTTESDDPAGSETGPLAPDRAAAAAPARVRRCAGRRRPCSARAD